MRLFSYLPAFISLSYKTTSIFPDISQSLEIFWCKIVSSEYILVFCLYWFRWVVVVGLELRGTCHTTTRPNKAYLKRVLNWLLREDTHLISSSFLSIFCWLPCYYTLLLRLLLLFHLCSQRESLLFLPMCFSNHNIYIYNGIFPFHRFSIF